MKVKTLIRFDDLLEKVPRYEGDIFEVSKERYEEILTKGGKWVEIVEDEKDEKVGKSEVIDLTKLKRKELEEIAKDKEISEEDIKNAQNKEALIELIEGV